MKNGLPWLGLSAVVILIDQMSKWWAFHFLQPLKIMPIFPGLNFIFSTNYGTAFGLFDQKGSWAPWLLGSVAVVISVLIISLLARVRKQIHWVSISLALILAGAIGNVIDRIYHGFVIDFIDVYFGHWHFWTFNVADVAITMGAIMLCIDILFLKDHEQ